MRSLTKDQWAKGEEHVGRLWASPSSQWMIELSALRDQGEDPDILSLVALQLRLPAEEEHRRIGQKVGNFTLKRQIGIGGMGVAYLAEQDMPRREVVVKLVHPAL